MSAYTLRKSDFDKTARENRPSGGADPQDRGLPTGPNPDRKLDNMGYCFSSFPIAKGAFILPKPLQERSPAALRAVEGDLKVFRLFWPAPPFCHFASWARLGVILCARRTHARQVFCFPGEPGRAGGGQLL
jgi:hypothetical protein